MGSTASHDMQRSPPGTDGGHPALIIVMGVSGCGKSTLGSALAAALSLPFIDGDKLHPPSNIAKMSAGTPLTDADRLPWLRRIRARALELSFEDPKLHDHEKEDHHWHHSDGRGEAGIAAEEIDGRMGLVVACSSLKRSYRAILRGAHDDDDDDGDGGDDVDGEQPQPQPIPPKPKYALPTYFVYIHGERDDLLQRMSSRQGHFMKASMLDSQLATLEDPTDDPEGDVVVVQLADETPRQAANAKRDLLARGLKPGVKPHVESSKDASS